MALDHPVLNLPSGGWLRGSRVLELGLVVSLAVAVVVVAAAWGSSSTPVEAPAVGSVDQSGTVPASPPADAAPLSNDLEARTVASTGTERSAMPSATEVARPETDLAEGITPVGVAGEVPVFGLRPLPSSFEQYQVKRGETLDTIADAWSLTVPDLLLWNSHLEEDSILIPGEWLSIPQWDAPAVAEESGLSADDGKNGRGGG